MNWLRNQSMGRIGRLDWAELLFSHIGLKKPKMQSPDDGILYEKNIWRLWDSNPPLFITMIYYFTTPTFRRRSHKERVQLRQLVSSNIGLGSDFIPFFKRVTSNGLINNYPFGYFINWKSRCIEIIIQFRLSGIKAIFLLFSWIDK